MENTPALRKAYSDYQKVCGLQKGDIVQVVASCPGYTHGWQCSWVSDMEKTVNDGKTYKVLSVDNEEGIELDQVQCYYPAFVLQLVKRPEPLPEFVLSRDYKAVVQEDGTVVVGCQRIKPELLQQIAAASAKAVLTNKTGKGYIPSHYNKEKVLKLLKPGEFLLAYGDKIWPTDHVVTSDSYTRRTTNYSGYTVGGGSTNAPYIRQA